MTDPLRERVPPRTLAERREVITGERPLRDFERLADIVQRDLAHVSAHERPAAWLNTAVKLSLKFGFEDNWPRIPALTGRAATRVPAVCQRCLGVVEIGLEVELELLLPEPSDDVPTDTGSFEVWEQDDAVATPMAIVEESLVMAMPFAAMHTGDANCRPPQDEVDDRSVETVRPFAGLKALLDADEE